MDGKWDPVGLSTTSFLQSVRLMRIRPPNRRPELVILGGGEDEEGMGERRKK